MTEQDRVFDAFRSCITEPKCNDCPWTECEKLKNRRVEIPIDLALAVMRMLEAQEPVKPISCKSYIHTEPITFDYECPICMTGIMRNWVACPICGQAVKWE